jgi:uncharacterized protein with ParB-like and HNH nuclease domain/predicted transport protein
MKASEAKLLEFLALRKQLVIPIYQRTYSWTRPQCQQLWNDILRVATDSTIPAHFLGSVVYIQEGIYHASSTQQMLVIDGQQRLTTVSLILIALANVIGDDESNGINRDTINDYYLFNRQMKAELRYKLMLTRSDKDTYIALIEGGDLPTQSSHRLLDNFKFFVEAVKGSGLSYDAIFEGLSKLLIVDVSLNREYDNPQLIFESLNSTGLDLSQADLIRNYVLMGLSPEVQQETYLKYWYPMEERFGHTEYVTLFDRFMRDYLTMKSEAGTIPNIDEVYVDFKKFILGKHVLDVVADIALYSQYYVRLALPHRNTDRTIEQLLENINALKVDVAYPLLLEAFDDFERHKTLSRDGFIEILQIIESYVFRRAIVGIPTNSMNKTFATFKRSINKNDYSNSVRFAFANLDSYRRFPKDDEFRSEFVMKDVYNLRLRRNYLMSKLENHQRKEFVDTDEYTIEHILPQNPNLSREWQIMLGDNWKEVQSRYVHTIGNLTLTGYNPELSDRVFTEKRDMKGGFRDSPLRINQSLRDLVRWGIQEISDRAQELASLALQIWSYPEIDENTLQKYREPANGKGEHLTLDHFEYLNGNTREIFDALRVRILNLDPTIREEVKKLYIAYKTTTNFVDVIPQKSRLRLTLNLRFDEINDPQAKCRDVTGMGRWGNGDVEFGISTLSEIDYAMFLVRQSYMKHTDED